MSDDITFCGSECNNTRCRRHRSNIKEPQYPHSVALLEGTEYCDKKYKPTSVRLIDAEAFKKEVENLVVGGAEGLKDYYENGSKSDENSWIGGVYDAWELIDNAPTVEINDKSLEIAQKSIELGRNLGRLECKAERPQGDLISREALLKAMEEERQLLLARGQTGAEHILVHHCLPIIDNAPTVPQGEYVDISKLRLMTVEECAGHTIDYAMGWKACIEWIKKGGAE